MGLMMSSGDVVVSGVTECVVIRDININVPYKKMVTIPGELALRSKELWAYISSNRLFPHTIPCFSIPQVQETNQVTEPTATNTALQLELLRVHEESARVQCELSERIEKLELENSQLKAEVGTRPNYEDKLQAILDRLDRLSTSAVQSATIGTPDNYIEEKVPIFIPSLPDARDIPGVITPKVIKTDGSEVERASRALRKFRKQGG